MSIWSNSIINRELSKRTSVFNLRLYVVIGVVAGVVFVLFLFLLSLCCCCSSSSSKKKSKKLRLEPNIAKNTNQNKVLQQQQTVQASPLKPKDLILDIVSGEGAEKVEGKVAPPPQVQPKVSHLGWGCWYTLREIEGATNGLSEENVIGEGGYGIVYRGVLVDGTEIAVKNLLNNKGQAEREFKVEVEAIGRVRHKHLVRLLGYCAEGEYRMLVYEYVDNGNLDQWLHGEVGDVSPLTWEIRMNIILGTAKGLAYLHEGLEPKVVHRDVKASNILLNQQWNPKISDFGLAKHLGSEKTYVTTRVMGTFGYVAPEYASTGMLNERSDVYSFGVLIMEIISGRTPVDYRRPRDEVHLVEWLKLMVGNRRSEEVVDPKILKRPSPKALKRALLIALRCVDPDSHKRPKMGNVVHMLEMDNILFGEGKRLGEHASVAHPNSHSNDKRAVTRYN